MAEDIGQYEMPIVFTFQRQDLKKNLIVIREMVVSVQEKYEKIPFIKSPYTSEDWDKSKQIIRTDESKSVDHYNVPKLLKILVARGLDGQSFEDLKLKPEEILELTTTRLEIRNIFEIGPTQENYKKYFHNLLYWEEVIARINLRKFNMSEVKLETRGDYYYTLQVPGLAEKRPSLLRGDFLFIRPNEDKDIIFEGKIKDIEDSLIVISGVDQRLMKYYSPTATFSVRFIMSRMAFERMHRAAEVYAFKHTHLIFPTPPNIPFRVKKINKFYNGRVAVNAEQVLAVERIVSRPLGAAPYIVFGPPGTGKTMTIVEAIVQLVAASPKNRVMVCTHSNMAADHVALTLLQYNAHLNLPNYILRANSRTREWSSMPPELASVSNGTKYDDSYSVTAEYASKYRILVTTLLHAAKYWPRGKDKGNLNITHLFVDEAAQATEPATVVPFGLLAAGARLVLAGDPRQLAPVVLSREAGAKGLKKSLLHRLMEVYPQMYTSDSDYITMLVQNYRSNPDILAIPNEFFYDSALQAKAEPDDLSTTSVLGLTGGDRAVVFHAVTSREQRMGEAPSFFNTKELEMIQRYTEALILTHGVATKDIGIIAPYIRQVYKIKNWLSSKQYRDVEVGTVESFQGKEKRVILVSTVRANCRLLDYDAKYDLGFLVDDKRFNVTLTRAKAKLIIIGNPTCLTRDRKWRKYMEFCRQLNCYLGSETQQMERTAALLTDVARTRFDICRLTNELKIKDIDANENNKK
ncbi:probable RNA helicase SDE3 isoform X2 [Aricia agestis]|nr:probable RNA helicase SDE3 isoform X2 [Aricia agestis]XP_041969110.1 probable RNA helicase SDE3 isoform X2 [Aricia agestis]XP_041969111.1 probable RNA helicase SDE3 isoform X2 [Aricia agestis]